MGFQGVSVDLILDDVYDLHSPSICAHDDIFRGITWISSKITL